MKETVTKNAILFIIFTLFTFISSCNPDLYEFPQKDIATQNEISVQLLSLMSDQKGSYMRFQEKLGPHKPLYDYVQTGNSTDFGLYYAIPYLDEKDSLSGCIVYPIDENCDEEVRSYKGILGNPINLNQDYLENEIPITRRFLYSARFLQWKNIFQQNSSKKLYLFAKKMKEKSMIIQDKTTIKLRSTTTSINAAEVEFYFDYMRYTGRVDGAAHALSPNTLNNMILGSCRDYLPVKNIVIGNLHNSSIRATITFRQNNMDPSSLNSSLFNVVQEIVHNAKINNFDIFIQFNYIYAYTSNTSSSGTSSSGSGGSYYQNPENNPKHDKSEIEKKIPPVEDCQKDKTDSICKNTTKNILSRIKETQKDTIYKKYSDFQSFLNKVQSDNVEYSISFEQYPATDGQSMENRITSPIRGEQYRVMNTLDSYTTATIHNHINGSPPSITDLFYTANLPNTAPQCKTTYIYNQLDSTFYALQIINSDKAKLFYTKYNENELDKETNGYKQTGDFQSFLSNRELNCSPSELELYKLVAILDNFDAGIKLVKVDKRNSAITYSARKQIEDNGIDKKIILRISYCGKE